MAIEPSPPEPVVSGLPAWTGHPALALGVGLLIFPLAKVLYLPAYVFNFLATLVHEIGHCVCAWLMGMPSVPAVSPAGGGVTTWQEQKILICIVIVGAGLAAAHTFRARKPVFFSILALVSVYAALAFSPARQLLPVAGGILFEIGGASLCFHRALAPDLERPIERPIWALWGWWMLLNRGAETALMLSSYRYWQSQRVIESGLAAGLTTDLEVLREKVGIYSPSPILWLVMALCVLALPTAIGITWVQRRGLPFGLGGDGAAEADDEGDDGEDGDFEVLD